MRQHLEKLFPKNSFAENVSLLAGGAGAAQLIILLASPILTRLYSPEAFGLMAVYTSLLSVLGVIASFRYQIAIPLPKDTQIAVQVLVLSLLLTLFSAAFWLVTALTFGDAIAEVLGAPDIAALLLLFPLGILFYGMYEILDYWAIRVRAFRDITHTKLTKATATVSVQIAASVLGPVALVLGQIVGHAVGIQRLAKLAYHGSNSYLKSVNLRALRQTAYRYRNLPTLSAWSELMGTASISLPLILIAALFSSAAAGLYSIAQRILNQPMVMVGQAVSDVFLADAVVAHRAGTLAARTEQVHAALVRLGMPMIFVLFQAGELIFAAVFGADWREAGTFAAYLAPWMYLKFVASPATSVVTVLERQRMSAIFNTAVIVLRVALISVSAVLLSLNTTMALFGALNFFLVAVFLGIVFRMLKLKLSKLIILHLKFFLIGVFVFTLPSLLIKLYLHSELYSFIALAVAVALYYLYCLYWFKKQDTLKEAESAGG